MVSDEQIGTFVNSLLQDEEIRSLFVTCPEAATVPFQKSPTDLFFAISFGIRLESVTLRNLALISQRIVHKFIKKGLAKDLKAIDVLISAKMNGEFDRVLRFSVYEPLFDTLPELLPLDFLNREPVEGIRCGWYWDSSRVPLEQQ